MWKTWRRELSSTSGRWLLLNGLLIGIAPSADLQAAANPAQAFRGIGRANRAADRTLLRALGLIGHHRKLGLIQKLRINHRIWGRWLCGRRWFTFHLLKTTVPCLAIARLRGAIHAHDISRIESSRAPRAFLTGFHLGGLSRWRPRSLPRCACRWDSKQTPWSRNGARAAALESESECSCLLLPHCIRRK